LPVVFSLQAYSTRYRSRSPGTISSSRSGKFATERFLLYYKLSFTATDNIKFSNFPQAAARQSQYEQSAVGKAAIKSVKAIQEEKKNPQGRPGGVDTSRDWLS
jgi:hypothetical protein